MREIEAQLPQEFDGKRPCISFLTLEQAPMARLEKRRRTKHIDRLRTPLTLIIKLVLFVSSAMQARAAPAHS